MIVFLIVLAVIMMITAFLGTTPLSTVFFLYLSIAAILAAFGILLLRASDIVDLLKQLVDLARPTDSNK